MRIICSILLFVFFTPSFAQKSDSLTAIELFKSANKISEALPDSSIKIYENLIQTNSNRSITLKSYLRLFEICYNQRRDLVKGLGLSMKIAELYQKTNDTLNYIRQYRNISVILGELNRNEEALSYTKEVLAFAKRKNIPDLIISASISISEYYSFNGRTDTAVAILENLKSNLPVKTENSDLAALNMNLGNFYFNFGKETESPENYRHAIYTAKQTISLLKDSKGEEAKVGFSYGLIAASNMELGNLPEAERNYKYALNVFEKSKRHDQLEGLYFELIQLYIKMGDKERSIYYLEKHDSISRQMYNEESAKSVSEMKIQFETDKKDAEYKLLQIENTLSIKTLKQQKIITFFIIGGLIIVSVFAFFIFYGLKKQRLANSIISKQKIEVETQKLIVETKAAELSARHKEISDSIMYAERIQRSFLATKSLLDENLREYFVFFKPKDVVSGDFYWASKLTNGNFTLVTADSTGHGVPGAIMSILNITSLEKAVDQGLTQPSEILNHTRKTIIERLKKDGSAEGGKDGMDASIAVYDFERKKLLVAAANTQVWIVRASVNSLAREIIEIKSDKMPIGKHEKENTSFVQQEIDLKSGDVIYSLTDGFPDQFGGPNGKKFMSKNLRELLAKNAHLPMQEQKLILEKTFNEWIACPNPRGGVGNMEQVDDVTLIGVRV